MQREEIKSGFLQVPPSWLQNFLNKPWAKKQCVLYPASRQGLQRLEVFDLAPSLRRKEPAALIIPLTDCVKIAEEHYKGKDFVFSVVTREGSHMFATASVQELRDWVDSLQKIAFGKSDGRDCPKMLPLMTSKSQEDKCDDNVLYGSTIQHRSMFPVTVDENETTLRLQLSGPHVVQIAAAAVQLRTLPERRLRAAWLFSHIRRYGKTGNSFAMEVGRSSETGPGSFVFRTREAAELQVELQRVMAEYELNRHSAAPDLPTSPPPQQPPPPPPPQSLETQTLGRFGSGRKVKTTAIAKPPRRTKATVATVAAAAAAAAATAEDLPNVVPLAEKQWLLTQSLKMAPPEDEPEYSNEVLLSALSAPYVNEPEELVYAEPEERQSAWRELGRSVEHVEHSVGRCSGFLEAWDAAPAAAAAAEQPRPLGGGGGGRISASYALLQHMPCSTEPSSVGLYARLGASLGSTGPEERTAAWAADQSQRQGAAAEVAEVAAEAAEVDSQPVYENLPAGPAGSQLTPGAEAGAGSQQGSVKRVLVNEDEYTLLDKPLLK